MYDISYCALEKSAEWQCPKADSCKRNQERKTIPEGAPYSVANLYNICAESECSLYIPYHTEIEVVSKC